MVKRVAVGMLMVLVAGMLSLTVPADVAIGQDGAVTIEMGEFYFGSPDSTAPVGDASKPEVSIVTIDGASSGEIVIELKNVGQIEHEVVSTLFEATTETKVKTFDAAGNEISKVETIGALREVELQGGMTAEVTLVLDEAVVRTFEEDPDHELVFELSCFVGHGTAASHYKAGMRALITLKA